MNERELSWAMKATDSVSAVLKTISNNVRTLERDFESLSKAMAKLATQPSVEALTFSVNKLQGSLRNATVMVNQFRDGVLVVAEGSRIFSNALNGIGWQKGARGIDAFTRGMVKLAYWSEKTAIAGDKLWTVLESGRKFGNAAHLIEAYALALVKAQQVTEKIGPGLSKMNYAGAAWGRTVAVLTRATELYHGQLNGSVAAQRELQLSLFDTRQSTEGMAASQKSAQRSLFDTASTTAIAASGYKQMGWAANQAEGDIVRYSTTAVRANRAVAVSAVRANQAAVAGSRAAATGVAGAIAGGPTGGGAATAGAAAGMGLMARLSAAGRAVGQGLRQVFLGILPLLQRVWAAIARLGTIIFSLASTALSNLTTTFAAFGRGLVSVIGVTGTAIARIIVLGGRLAWLLARTVLLPAAFALFRVALVALGAAISTPLGAIAALIVALGTLIKLLFFLGKVIFSAAKILYSILAGALKVVIGLAEGLWNILKEVGKVLLSIGKMALQAAVGFFKLELSLAAIIVKLLAAAAAAGQLALGLSIRFTANFEQGLANVRAATETTKQTIQGLGLALRGIAKDSTYSAEKLADASYYLGSAGFSVGQIKAAMPGIEAMAQAFGEELAPAAELTAGILTQYGLAAEDSARAANVLAKANALSLADFQKLAEGMVYVGSIAGTLNVSLEESVAALALLYNAGLKGEMAGRSLRDMMLSVLNVTDEHTAALAKLGLTYADVDPRVVGLAGSIGKMADAGMDAAMANRFFGEMTVGAFLAIKNAGGTKALQDMTAALTGTNAAFEQAAAQTDTLASQWKKLKSAINEVMLVFGTPLQEPLKKAVAAFKDFLNFASATPQVRGLAQAIADVVSGWVNIFVKFLDNLRNNWDETWNRVMGSIKRVGMSISAVIGAIVGAFKYLSKAAQGSGGFFQRLLDFLVQVHVRAAIFIVRVLRGLQAVYMEVFAGGFLTRLPEIVFNIFKAVAHAVALALSRGFRKGKELWNNFLVGMVETFLKLPTIMYDAARGIAVAIVSGIAGGLNKARKMITDFAVDIATLGGKVPGGDWAKKWLDKIGNFEAKGATDLAKWISDYTAVPFKAWAGTVDEAGDAFKRLLKDANDWTQMTKEANIDEFFSGMKWSDFKDNISGDLSVAIKNAKGVMEKQTLGQIFMKGFKEQVDPGLGDLVNGIFKGLQVPAANDPSSFIGAMQQGAHDTQVVWMRFFDMIEERAQDMAKKGLLPNAKEVIEGIHRVREVLPVAQAEGPSEEALQKLQEAQQTATDTFDKAVETFKELAGPMAALEQQQNRLRDTMDNLSQAIDAQREATQASIELMEDLFQKEFEALGACTNSLYALAAENVLRSKYRELTPQALEKLMPGLCGLSKEQLIAALRTNPKYMNDVWSDVRAMNVGELRDNAEEEWARRVKQSTEAMKEAGDKQERVLQQQMANLKQIETNLDAEVKAAGKRETIENAINALAKARQDLEKLHAARMVLAVEWMASRLESLQGGGGAGGNVQPGGLWSEEAWKRLQILIGAIKALDAAAMASGAAAKSAEGAAKAATGAAKATGGAGGAGGVAWPPNQSGAAGSFPPGSGPGDFPGRPSQLPGGANGPTTAETALGAAGLNDATLIRMLHDAGYEAIALWAVQMKEYWHSVDIRKLMEGLGDQPIADWFTKILNFFSDPNGSLVKMVKDRMPDLAAKLKKWTEDFASEDILKTMWAWNSPETRELVAMLVKWRNEFLLPPANLRGGYGTANTGGCANGVCSVPGAASAVTAAQGGAISKAQSYAVYVGALPAPWMGMPGLRYPTPPGGPSSNSPMNSPIGNPRDYRNPRIPHFQHGGVMPETGLAVLHAGEVVVPQHDLGDHVKYAEPAYQGPPSGSGYIRMYEPGKGWTEQRFADNQASPATFLPEPRPGMFPTGQAGQWPLWMQHSDPGPAYTWWRYLNQPEGAPPEPPRTWRDPGISYKTGGYGKGLPRLPKASELPKGKDELPKGKDEQKRTEPLQDALDTILRAGKTVMGTIYTPPPVIPPPPIDLTDPAVRSAAEAETARRRQTGEDQPRAYTPPKSSVQTNPISFGGGIGGGTNVVIGQININSENGDPVAIADAVVDALGEWVGDERQRGAGAGMTLYI